MAGPRGLRARPLLSPPRLPQGRRARGRDARIPGAAEAWGARSDATTSRGSRGCLDAVSWPNIRDWGPAFAWAACGVQAWMEEESATAAAPPPSGMPEGAIPPPGRRRTPRIAAWLPEASRSDSRRPQHSGRGAAHSQAPRAGPTPPPQPGLARPGPTPPPPSPRSPSLAPSRRGSLSATGDTYSDHSCEPGGRGPCWGRLRGSRTRGALDAHARILPGRPQARPLQRCR